MDAVIFGNGPSLDTLSFRDIESFRASLTIGINRASISKKLIDSNFLCKIYCNFDPPHECARDQARMEALRQLENKALRVSLDDPQQQPVKWPYDLLIKKTYNFPTSSLFAAEFAIKLGAKTVKLIAHDHIGMHCKTEPFVEDKTSWNNPWVIKQSVDTWGEFIGSNPGVKFEIHPKTSPLNKFI